MEYFISKFVFYSQKKYIHCYQLCIKKKKIYRLIVVDQHQYFDGHVQVECSFSYGILRCYNKNFTISVVLKMLTLK